MAVTTDLGQSTGVGPVDLDVSTPVYEEVPVRGDLADPSLLGLSGVDRLRHSLAAGGPLPPVHYLTGLTPTDADVGAVTFVMPATAWLRSPHGFLSGGALAVLADAALGTAVQSTLPAGGSSTTGELSMNLLRPVTADGGLLLARARTVRSGRSIAFSDAVVLDAQGRMVASASSRCHVFPPAELTATQPPPGWVEPSYDGPHPFERPVKGGVIPPDQWLQLSGAELLQAQRLGQLPLPPVHYLTGINVADWSPGTSVVTAPASPWFMQPRGTVHGGVICLIAEYAIAAAVQTMTEAGQGFAMLDLKTSFTRPVTPDGGQLTARGRLIHSGRTTRIGAAEVVAASGKVVACATGTALITDRPFCAPVDPEVAAAAS